MSREQIWKPSFDGSLEGGQQLKRYDGSSASRWEKLIRGDITIADLDDEEIARGMVKNDDGVFAGRPPANVPRVVFDAMRREIFKRGQDLWSKYYLAAIETLAGVMSNPKASPYARMQAAVEIVNRIEGKPVDRTMVKISADHDQQVEIVGKAIVKMLTTLGLDMDRPDVREVAYRTLNEVSSSRPKVIEGEIDVS